MISTVKTADVLNDLYDNYESARERFEDDDNVDDMHDMDAFKLVYDYLAEKWRYKRADR